MESEVLPRQWLQIVEVRRTPPKRALGEEAMGAGRGRGRRKRERRRPFTLVQNLAVVVAKRCLGSQEKLRKQAFALSSVPCWCSF